MLPFKLLADKFDSVMPAHIIFEQVDAMPAGFSQHWLKNVLRSQLGFKGVIFSDDLTMEGASVVGGDTARGMAALNAGCDVVLLCNDPARCDALLAGLVGEGVTAAQSGSDHLLRMQAQKAVSLTDAGYVRAKAAVEVLGAA